MKTILQVLMLICTVAIFHDIANCNRSKESLKGRQVNGLVIDAVTKEPLRGISIKLEYSNGNRAAVTTLDEEGRFSVDIKNAEIGKCSLQINDSRYLLVNSHQRADVSAKEKIWYVLSK